jgi:hypothetical protein
MSLQEAAAGEAGWMDRLLDFYEAVLVQGQVLPASGGLGQAAAQPAIPADVYSTVLAGKHALLLPVINTIQELPCAGSACWSQHVEAGVE